MFLRGSYGLKFLQYIYYIAIYLYLINILIYFYFVIYLFSKFLLLGILHQKMAKKYFSPVNFMKNIPCLRASLNSGIYQTGTLFYHFVLFVIILWIHPQPVLGKAACLAHSVGCALSVVKPQRAGGVPVESFGLGSDAVWTQVVQVVWFLQFWCHFCIFLGLGSRITCISHREKCGLCCWISAFGGLYLDSGLRHY